MAYTFEEFLIKAKQTHGDKYIYTKEGFEHRKINRKIIYRCPIHNIDVEQRITQHLKGSGCKECGKLKISEKSKTTFEEFVSRAIQIHGDKYIYDKDSYKSNHESVKIYCKKHKYWFEQLPCNHFKGCGCPKCGGNYRKTNDEYIKYLSEKYPDTNISFKHVNYVNNHTPVKLICPIHDEFELTPITLETNLECPECQKLRFHNKFAKTTLDFINEANIVHNFKYKYDKTEYKTYNSDVIITCPIHGDFPQTPATHLKGSGCPKCGDISMWDKRGRMTTEKFIEKSKEIHGDRWIYTKTIYENAHKPLIITCRKHGDFRQDPYSHLKGSICPDCNYELSNSFGENEVRDFIKTLISDKIYSNSRKLIYPLELDIYIPSYKVAFEYDGLYWHSDIKVDNKYHLNKTNKCKENGIQLFHIFDDEWINKKEIVKSKLKSILGKVDRKIYARKCFIKEINSKDLKAFLEENHLQGNVNSKYRYGLFYNDELVSVISFGSVRKNMGKTNTEGTYELLRFCSKLNTTVVGGASKLLKHFINKVKPSKIITYADKRWSNGNLYIKLGFKHIRDSKPNYFYLINNKRENRFKYRKDVLVKEGYDPLKSEYQIMKERNINRIYDCGTMVFEMNFE